MWINGDTLNYITVISEKAGKHSTMLHQHVDSQSYAPTDVSSNRKKD